MATLFSFAFSKRTVLINSTGLRENRAATAGDSAGELFLSGLCLPLFVCVLMFAYYCLPALYVILGLLGGYSSINPIPGFGAHMR